MPAATAHRTQLPAKQASAGSSRRTRTRAAHAHVDSRTSKTAAEVAWSGSLDESRFPSRRCDCHVCGGQLYAPAGAGAAASLIADQAAGAGLARLARGG